MTVQNYPKIGIGIDDYHQTESRDSIEQKNLLVELSNPLTN